jgi:hypothetical protein
MPPSGYTKNQVKFIESFLRSCGAALVEEGKSKSETIGQSLAREIRDIDAYQKAIALSDDQLSVLNLTKEFYEKISGQAPRDEIKFWAAVDSAISEIEESVLRIHISDEVLGRVHEVVTG